MADERLSIQDIESLAAKLDEVADVLTEKEKAILLGVFGLAAASLSGAAVQAEDADPIVNRKISSFATAMVELPEGELPKLSDGFKDAFVPGKAGRFTIPGGEVMDSVSVGVGCVGWSKDYNKLDPGDIVTQPGVEGINELASLQRQLAQLSAQLGELETRIQRR